MENVKIIELVKKVAEERNEIAFSELFELIPVSESDANELACNAVVIEDTVIFPSENIDAIKAVEDLGLTSKVANVSEFLKSGGACQCLVIALN